MSRLPTSSPELPPLPARGRSARMALLLAPAAALLMLAAGPAAAAAPGQAAAVPPGVATAPAADAVSSTPVSLASVSLAHVSRAPVSLGAADNGQRSFGVQPAGPKKPDPRPNFTYTHVRPGQRLIDHVAFVNISALPVTLTVYPADGYNTPAGAFDLRTQKQPAKDIGAWVQLRRHRVTIPARSALVTPIQIQVPRNAEPGDHAGGIVASLRTLARDRKGNTVTVDDRVGSRMYIRVAGKLRPHVMLAQNGASYQSSNPFTRGDAEVSYTIRNDGNVRLTGTKTIRISDLFGGSKQAAQIPQMPELLPGYSFTFSTRVAKVLPALLLTAHVTIDPRSVAGNVDPALEQVSASSTFWAMYWPLIGLLVLAALAGAWFWHRRRRSSGRGSGGPGSRGGHVGDDDLDPSDGGTPHRMADARTRVMSPRAVRRSIVVALLGFAAVGGGVLGAGPAQAAGGGGLTFIPGKGMDISPLYAVTSAPCPAAAPNLIGRMYGKGFPSDGVVVIPNGDASIQHDAPFGVPLQDTIAGFASDHGVKLKGRYTITVQCINRFGTKVFSSFSGAVTFGDAKHFTAPQPKTPPSEGVPVGFLSQIFPEFKAGSPAAGPSAPALSPSPAATRDGGAAVAGAADGGIAQDTGSNVTPYLVIVGGVLLLGGVGFVATRRPAAPRRQPQGKARVQWPDEDGAAVEHAVPAGGPDPAGPSDPSGPAHASGHAGEPEPEPGPADRPGELVAVPDLDPGSGSDSDVPTTSKETN